MITLLAALALSAPVPSPRTAPAVMPPGTYAFYGTNSLMLRADGTMTMYKYGSQYHGTWRRSDTSYPGITVSYRELYDDWSWGPKVVEESAVRYDRANNVWSWSGCHLRRVGK